MSKLSPTQIEVLRRMAEPGDKLNYFPQRGWCFLNGDPVSKKTIKLLWNEWLINRERNWPFLEAHITDKGREFLAKLDKEAKDDE